MNTKTATRTWSRAVVPVRCGLCNGTIARGDALILVKLPLLIKRTLYRCKGCVGPAPPDLPPLIERELPGYKPFVHITTDAHALPLDFKSAAAGREPGEEG